MVLRAWLRSGFILRRGRLPAARTFSLRFGDNMPLAAAIGAGGSLLGGILGRSSESRAQKRQIAFAREEREYNKPINVRARAEEAGFNPLLFAGPGVGNAASGGISGGGTNYMGQAIADAGMLIAEGMRNKSAETKRINDLETQNKELQKKLVDQTVRPRVGGIYEAGGITVQSPERRQEQAAEMFGPRPLVRLRDAVSGNWFGVDPAVADRLDLKDGDAWIGEDGEAVFGEVMGNVNSTLSAASGISDRGFYDGPMYDAPLGAKFKPFSEVAPYLPDGESIDWSATTGSRAPVKPEGMTDKAWERLVKRNRAIQGFGGR